MVNRREIPQANPPFNAPFLDTSGRVSQDWQRWISNTFSRQGGTQDDIWNGLFQGLVSATQINSVTAQLSSVQDEFASVRSEIAAHGDDRQAIVALEDEVATLRSMLAAKIIYDDQLKLLQQQLVAVQQQNDMIMQQQEVAKRDADTARSFSRAIELQQQQINYSRQWASVQAIADTDQTVSNLTTSSIPEGARLYYTDARARASVAAGGSLNYNSVTGVFSIVVGSAAYQNTGTSGANVPLLNTANTWGALQAFGAGSTAVTQLVGDNSTNVSTTAFVAAGFMALSGGTLTGPLSVGNGASSATLNINGATSTTRDIVWQTNGSPVWRARANSTPQSGSNAGSDFAFGAFDDAGASLGNVYTINRASRVMTFTNNIGVGTYVATPGTITGYIAIFDSAGNVRKIAVTT